MARILSSERVLEYSKEFNVMFENSFKKIATLNLENIYQDTNDKRLWLLTYPKSHMPDGASPCIECLSMMQVNEKTQNQDN